MALGSPATTTATLDTGIPPSGPAQTNAPAINTSGGTNGLYLYTFLITLLVLFAVSSGIVIRSCILRRRFRRQMQLAIEGGGIVMPNGGTRGLFGGKKERVFGEKPVLWEVWMREKDGEEAHVGVLDTLQLPMSANITRPSSLPVDPIAQEHASDPTPPVILTRETAQQYLGVDMRTFGEVVRDHWQNARRRMPLRAATPPDEAGSPTPQEKDHDPLDDGERRLTLGFVIAMPDSRRPSHHNHRHVQPRVVDLEVHDLEYYSPEELDRGKMKALKENEDDDDAVDLIALDEELPDVMIGVLDVDWTGKGTVVPPAPEGAESTPVAS